MFTGDGTAVYTYRKGTAHNKMMSMRPVCPCTPHRTINNVMSFKKPVCLTLFCSYVMCAAVLSIYHNLIELIVLECYINTHSGYDIPYAGCMY